MSVIERVEPAPPGIVLLVGRLIGWYQVWDQRTQRSHGWFPTIEEAEKAAADLAALKVQESIASDPFEGIN